MTAWIYFVWYGDDAFLGWGPDSLRMEDRLEEEARAGRLMANVRR